METIMIGQRVRVIDAHLVHYRQVGVVVALHADEGCYVHLDYDDDLPDGSVFFHTEELEAVPNTRTRAHRAQDANQDPSEQSSEPA